MSSNPYNYMDNGWSRDCACGLAVRLARVCGLSLQPIGCTSTLACDVQRYCSCSCRLWRYISVMPLLLPVRSPQNPYGTKGNSNRRTEPWKVSLKFIPSYTALPNDHTNPKNATLFAQQLDVF